MAKPSIRVGVGVGTGQPANGPKGPYITADDDGTRPQNPSSSAPEARPQQSERGDHDARQRSETDSGPETEATPRRTVNQKPDLPDELARRSVGPAQPRGN